MKLLDKVIARRRRKAHERYLAERARQRELSGQDAQDAVRNFARDSAGQNGTFGLGQ